MKLSAIVVVVLFSAVLTANSSNAARILGFIPTPSYSHQIFFHPLWIALAERGHDVTIIVADPIPNNTLPNLRQIDISSVYTDVKSTGEFKNVMKGGTSLKMLYHLFDFLLNSIQFEFGLDEVKQALNPEQQHYDVVMVECLLPVMSVLREHLNTSLIQATSLDATDLVHGLTGNPEHSALYPFNTLPFKKAETIMERFVSLLNTQIFQLINRFMFEPRQNELMLKHFGRIYDLTENVEQAAMLFVNANPIFSYARPVTPSTINLGGGMHITPAKKLPNDVAQFLDASKDGVVYFSLGSNVRSADLDGNLRDILLQTFAKLPYKVLWKFENDNLPGKPSNVYINKWLPQQDVLRHRNVKMFITQCGLQSLEEAFFLNVPVLGMPFFADQHGNAKAVEKYQIGVTIDYKTMTADSLRAAIIETVQNPIYAENVKRLSAIVKDQPMTPVERAVWWTEYVIRHKEAPFNKGPRLPFYKYYFLDVFALIGGVLYVVYKLIKITLGCTYRCIKKACSRKVKTT